MDLPVNVSTGMVVGRYIADVIDGPDTNLDPDAQPVQGRIVFTASVPYLPNPTAGPDPVTIMRVPIVGVLDQEGYLCTPYPGTLEPQYRGVRLIATDDPDVSVTDWTWDVTYIFEPISGHKLAIPAHSFALPSGSTQDLTTLVQVPSSPGYGLPQAEAAVNETITGAVVVGDDLQMTRRNGDTFIAGNVRGAQGLQGIQGIQGPAGISNADQFYTVAETAGRTVRVWDYLSNRYQLIYGDTGSRQISSLAAGVTSGSLLLTRELNTVTLSFNALITTQEGAADLLVLPVGFRPSSFVYGTTTAYWSSESAEEYRIHTNGTVRFNSVVAGAGLSGNLTFRTDNPWPTSLPGSAVGSIPA